MRRSLWRLVEEFDAVLALLIAVAVGLLGLVGITSSGLAQNAVLVTLGVLAVAILRDRSHRETAESRANATAQELRRLLATFPEQIDRVATLQHTLDESRRVIDRATMVRLISEPEVARVLADARRHTDRWLFKGGTGTYTRAVTLPGCVAMARQERRPLVVRLEILDPSDVAVCERYAQFRHSLSSQPDGTGEIWTAQRARIESCATILAACWYQARFRLLDVQVGLASTMSLFRFDLSSSCLLITQDDGRLPALMIPSDSFLFASFETDLRNSLHQARQVPLELAADVALSETPSVPEVEALFSRLGIALAMDDNEVDRLIQKALHAKNPYA